MQAYLDTFTEAIEGYSVDFFLALAVLVGGWLIALAISIITRKILERCRLDSHISRVSGVSEESSFHFAHVISRVVFYVLLLLVLVAFFRLLGLPQVTEPLGLLLNKVLIFLPKIVAAVLVLLIAWVLATVLRFLITKLLNASKIDRSLAKHAHLEAEHTQLSESIGAVVYWLIFLLFLPHILVTLDLEMVVSPFQNIIQQLLGFLPNAFGAVIILLFGWIFARICKQVVSSLLLSVGTERFSNRVGLKAMIGADLSDVAGKIVYALILIPTIIASLKALKVEAISEPATQMLTVGMNAIPYLFAAGVILLIAYVVAKLVGSLIENILTGVGFNRLFVALGLSKDGHAEGSQTPSHIAGILTVVTIMLFAFIEASEVLGFITVSNLIAQLIAFLGQVVLGLIIFGIGMYFAQLAHKIIRATGGSVAVPLAQIARVAIIVLAASMGVAQMGIAQDTINLTLALVIGAAALAFALAFGFGSKEIAARELEGWIKGFRNRD